MQIRPMLRSVRQFSSPSAGGPAYVNNNAILRVKGVSPANELVRVCAYTNGSQPSPTDNTPDANSVEAVRHGLEFYRGAVPVVQNANNNDVLILAGWASDDGGNSYEQFAQRACEAQIVTNLAVHATNCIHFAWAPDPAVGVLAGPAVGNREYKGEVEVGLDYSPAEVVVPTGMTQVQINVVGQTSWRNCSKPNCSTNETGTSGKLRTTRTEYSHAEYRSDGIPAIASTNLGMLVGLWADADPLPSGSPDPGRIVKFTETNTWNVYSGATRLFLGYHDSYEWNNNSGSCEVSLVWS